MAYEIHIERVEEDGSPLELDDWKSVVSEMDGLRLDPSTKSVVNPKTGQVLSIGGGDGDAEMLVDGQWLPVFRWFNGRVSFKGKPSFDDARDPIRKVVTQLATSLNARVVGDDGEFYD